MNLLYFIQSYGKEEDNKSPFSWIDEGEDKLTLCLKPPVVPTYLVFLMFGFL